MQNLSENWQRLYDELPPLVNRKTIAQTQLIANGTLANLDSMKKGIPNGRLVGKKICYPKNDVISFLMTYCGEAIEEVQNA